MPLDGHDRRADGGGRWRGDAPVDDGRGLDDGFRPSRGEVRFSVASFAGRIAVGYAMLASLATALTLALGDGVPWEIANPWLQVDASLRLGRYGGVVISAGLGIAFALLMVVATRFTVKRYAWAKRLHLDLRPMARGLGTWQIILVACFSSLGEELLFRGLLQPWLGVLPTAVLFGIVHYMPGEARWVWITWATFIGLAFGLVFQATGSLVGALLAHALINAINLPFLRDHDPLAPLVLSPPRSTG